jgi:hypothetical protein
VEWVVHNSITTITTLMEHKEGKMSVTMSTETKTPIIITKMLNQPHQMRFDKAMCSQVILAAATLRLPT